MRTREFRMGRLCSSYFVENTLVPELEDIFIPILSIVYHQGRYFVYHKEDLDLEYGT